MENKNAAYERVVDFITKEFGGKKEKMNLQTTLEGDLKITGDDGIDFINLFLKKFKIEYEQKENRPKYFDDEGYSPVNFVTLYHWIRGKKDNRKQYDLTLQHLVKVIEQGRWVDMDDK